MLRYSNETIAHILIVSQSKSKVKGIPESAVETSTGFYDGGYVLDPVKKLPNDIGRFVHVVADLGILSNSYASNYVQNLANLVGGFYSAIDPKSAIWNKGLNVTQIPGLVYTPTQMNALTFAKFNVLRSKGANAAPVLLHDRTAAIYDSDFTFVLRMNIHSLVIDTICQRADLYEGQSSFDGLQMTSMKSAMDEDMVKLQKRGYLSKALINISTTQAQQGRPSVLRQLLPGLSLLWRSQRLARGRGPGRSQRSAQRSPRTHQPGERPPWMTLMFRLAVLAW